MIFYIMVAFFSMEMLFSLPADVFRENAKKVNLPPVFIPAEVTVSTMNNFQLSPLNV